MCKMSAVLCQLDKTRYLTCCDHDIVHLVWRRLSFSLSWRDLRGLSSLLLQTYWSHRQGMCINCPHINIRDDARFELCLGEVILCLKLAELPELVEMFEEANEKLRHMSPAEYAHTFAQPTITPPQKFRSYLN